jgi:hypothetical protein
MGCWNKTCGLSNLQITAGTPVYVFVLERNSTYDGCYATGLYRPSLFPFVSEYNDYGGGENNSGAALDLIMGAIRRDLVEMPEGENKYHDIPVTRDGFDAEKFFDAVHEERLSIQGRFRREPIELSFTMMHKAIVDDLLKNRVLIDYVGNGAGNHDPYDHGSLDYRRYQFADIVDSLKPLLTQMLTDSQDLSKEEKFFVPDRMHNYCDQYLAASWMTRYSEHRYSRLVDVKRILRKMMEIGTEDAVDRAIPVFTEFLRGRFIDCFMEEARKTWVPGGHEGSQGSSDTALVELFGATLRVINRERKENGHKPLKVK